MQYFVTWKEKDYWYDIQYTTLEFAVANAEHLEKQGFDPTVEIVHNVD